MTARSSRTEVRNPVAADPVVAEIVLALPDEASEALEACLRALSARWRDQGNRSWAKHKAPMAAYHKANAINARHLAVALKRSRTAAKAAPKQMALALKEAA